MSPLTLSTNKFPPISTVLAKEKAEMAKTSTEGSLAFLDLGVFCCSSFIYLKAGEIDLRWQG